LITERKITRYQLALDQYHEACKENDIDPQEINEEYSYCQKRRGYWMLRDNEGHVVCAMEIKNGNILVIGGKSVNGK
tara:strand:- start:182 stop:412 length:231 start_codon:yes stop_codon:yes gene_type:complete